MMTEPWKVISDAWPAIYYMPGDNNGRYPYSNSMLIKTSKEGNEALLIDAGMGGRIVRKIRKEFSITRVLLSHWHEDHTTSVKKLNAPSVMCHPADIAPLVNMDTYLRVYGVAGTTIEAQFRTYMESIGMETLVGIEPMNPGELQLGDTSIQVIHAPGHSAGHCVFYEPRRKIAFLSDVDLSKFGPWYGCRDSSLEDFISTIKMLKTFDIDIAVTSHEDITEGKAIKEGLDYFLKKIDERNEKVLQIMQEKTTTFPSDIYDHNIVYRSYDKFGDYLRLAEGIMVDLHLQHLLRKGKITRQDSGFTLA